MQAPPPPRAHAMPAPMLNRSNSFTGHATGSMRRRGGEPRVLGVRERVPGNPWEDKAYVWVAEQDFGAPLKQRRPFGPKPESRKTEDWLFKQAIYMHQDDDMPIPLPPRPSSHQGHHHRSGSLRRDPPGTVPRPPAPRRPQPGWDDVIYRHEADVQRWMRQEETLRRVAEETLRERKRVEDELRRVDEKIRRLQREDAQRRLFEAESRARMQGHGAGARGPERKERPVRLSDQEIASRWEKYEARWSEITSASCSEELKFSNIPWPTISAARNAEDLSPAAIAAFLLSPAHSKQTSKKDRIRSAQLRWHPDRFRRLMTRVPEGEREEVEKAVGTVATVLNDMMQREKGGSK